MEAFIRSVPKLTFTLLLFSLITSLLTSYNLLPLHRLSFTPSIWKRSQYYRLFSSFFFHGTFSFGTFIHFLLYFNSSKQTELQGSGQYLYFTTLVYLISVISAFFVEILWISEVHFLAVVYVNCRRNRDSKIMLMGLPVQVSAAYLPYLLVALNFSWGSVIGIVIGHVYYFFEDVYPKVPSGRNRKYLNAPMVFLRISDFLRL